MKYGTGPRVPTYDYGPSDRKLRGGSARSMGSGSTDSHRRGYSGRSIESAESTLAATVVNHSRTLPSYAPKQQLSQRESYPPQDENSSNGQFRRFTVSHGSVDGQSSDDDGRKQEVPRLPTATSSSDHSEASLEPVRDTYVGVASPGMAAASLGGAATSGTVAVFGAATKTGQAFVRLALDAGYSVRALLGVGARAPQAEPQLNLGWVVGNLNDEGALRECVAGADFVVCTLAERKFKKQKHLLREFVERLYPIMKEEESIRVFLFQSCSLANDLNGRTPVLSKVIKTVTKRGSHSLRDQDLIIRFINSQHNAQDTETAISDKPSFSFLVTRPTILIKDGPSIKKLSASKSQPGPFAVTHIDLAEFSLNALLNVKLHNACPYVVAGSGL